VEGSSLGALPLDRDVYKTRLKFGESLEEKVMRVDILRLAYKMRFWIWGGMGGTYEGHVFEYDLMIMLTCSGGILGK
jgi:hypothetical protein